MKIQPPRRYTPPAYPTLAEMRQRPELLSRLPRRWTTSPRFVALLSIFVSLRAWLAGAGDPPAATPACATTVAQPESPRDGTTTAVQEATSMVVPFLDESMEYDGRGTFGCIAVNPPTFLAEDEALELIQQELRAAGLDLEDAVILEGVKAPEESPAATVDPRHFLFDFADRKRGVYIEYLSRADYDDWTDDDGMRSTVQDYDFAAASRRAAQTFQAWKTTTPVTFGIFFDPLASPVRPDVQEAKHTTQGLTDEQKALVRQLIKPTRYQQDDAATAEKAREKLRDQVRHFIASMNQRK
jgi:hypothetical protein